MPGRHTHLSSLQAGRAIAAVMVVIYHIDGFILPLRLYPGTGAALHPLAGMGYSGVEFFFALSGFLMFYIHTRDMGQPAKVRPYLVKRVSRIYPAYWLVVLPLILAGAVFPSVGIGHMPPLGDFLANISLAPMPGEPILGVSWTLQHEMAFYVLFALVIFSRRAGFILLGAWFLGCAIGLFLPQPEFPFSFVFSPYNLIFLFGAFAARSFRAMPTVAGWILLVAGVFCFLLTGANDTYHWVSVSFPHRTVLFGASAGLIIAALAALESRDRLKVPGALSLVGDASYMLYLIHIPAMTAAVPIALALRLPDMLAPWAMAILLVAGCTIASVVLHLYVEKPLVRMTARLLGGAGKREAKPAH